MCSVLDKRNLLPMLEEQSGFVVGVGSSLDFAISYSLGSSDMFPRPSQLFSSVKLETAVLFQNSVEISKTLWRSKAAVYPVVL